MPKVSVIIPAYNCQDFISETIESILKQTYKDYEIIVVDDGSCDRTAEIIQKYSRIVKYIYHSNGGPSKAKNTGILNAKGEYIAFLDHDDAWLPSKLDEQIYILEQNSRIALVYTDMYMLDKSVFTNLTLEGKRFFQVNAPHRGKVFDCLFQNNFIPTPSVVVRKECFKKVGIFNLSLPPVEDYDIWLKIAANYTIDYINKPLVKYRIHDRCFSRDSTVSLDKCIKTIGGIAESFGINKKIADGRLFNLYFNLGKAYLLRGDLKPARKPFLSALKLKYSFRLLLLFAATFVGRNIFLAIKRIYKALKYD